MGKWRCVFGSGKGNMLQLAVEVVLQQERLLCERRASRSEGMAMAMRGPLCVCMQLQHL